MADLNRVIGSYHQSKCSCTGHTSPFIGLLCSFFLLLPHACYGFYHSCLVAGGLHHRYGSSHFDAGSVLSTDISLHSGSFLVMVIRVTAPYPPTSASGACLHSHTLGFWCTWCLLFFLLLIIGSAVWTGLSADHSGHLTWPWLHQGAVQELNSSMHSKEL